jgi:hypothetical protein
MIITARCSASWVPCNDRQGSDHLVRHPRVREASALEEVLASFPSITAPAMYSIPRLISTS